SENIVEISIERGDKRGRGRLDQAYDELALDVTIGVKSPIKALDLRHRRRGVIDNGEKRQVLLRDVAVGEEALFDEREPFAPISPAREIDHDDGNDLTLSCLGQREDFQRLVVRPEAAREERER